MSGLSPATAGSSYYIMRTVWQMMAFVYTLLTVLCWATPLEEFVDSVAPVEEAAADAKHLKRELWQLTPRDRKRRDLKNQRKISRAVQSLLPTQQPANGASGAPDARWGHLCSSSSPFSARLNVLCVFNRGYHTRCRMRAKEERRRQEEARREYKERAKREKIEAKERLREAKEEQKAQQRMLREEEEARRAQEEKVQRRMRAVSNWEKFVVSLFAKDKQRRQRKAAQQKLKKQNVELYCEMGCSGACDYRLSFDAIISVTASLGPTWRSNECPHSPFPRACVSVQRRYRSASCRERDFFRVRTRPATVESTMS
eukprot:SAG11_NODE_258_length_11542_cov_35.970899_4_plen_314_part_00